MKRLGWIASVLLATVIGASAQVLTDDFNDGVLDSANWTPRTIRSGTAVHEGDGMMLFSNGGGLSVVPDVGPMEFSCRLQFTGHNYDVFYVILRSDGIATDTAGRLGNSLGVWIRPTNNPDSAEVGISDFETRQWMTTFSTPFPIVQNQFFTLTIQDDGASVTILVNDQLIGTLQTEKDFGDRVFLENRYLPGWPLTAEVDWVEINGSPVEVVDIKANGSDDLVVLAPGEMLTLTADLLADPAVAGDTWILALTSLNFPFNIFSYDIGSGSWFPWLFSFYGPSAQGAIPLLESAVLLQADGLPTGFYAFYMGYDPIPNRRIDFDQLEIDAVPVVIGNGK